MTEPEIPQPRAFDEVALSDTGATRMASGILRVGNTRILFVRGKPVAVQVFSGDVMVPDIYGSSGLMRSINAFSGTAALVRVTAPEFDYALANALMSQIRPLTRGAR